MTARHQGCHCCQHVLGNCISH